MKKQIAVAMGLAVISGSAFATKARLEALGEDHFGSQFISDNRNIFLNAAAVNYHKDIVTFEWGAGDGSGSTDYLGNDVTGGGTLTTTSDQDTAQTPKAEGGFLKASGNMVYGIYFGSESDVANGLRTLAMSNGVVHEANNIDLFVGGDAGVQWGANVTYSSTKNEQSGADEEQTSIRTRLGVISGNISGFANINLQNSAQGNLKQAVAPAPVGTEVEFTGKYGYDLGLTYEMNDIYYMLRHRAFAGEDKSSDEFKAAESWVGIAKAYRLNDKSNVWFSGWYKSNSYTNDFAFGGATGDRKDNFVPLALAAEVEVKDWLVLRGSVGHIIFGTQEDDDGDEVSIRNTFVKAGASLVFGDFQVDGLIGNANTCEQIDAGSGDTTESCTVNANSEAGILNTENLLSRVSLLYRF